MAKRMMELNPNSFRKLVATFLEANGRVSLSFGFFAERRTTTTTTTSAPRKKPTRSPTPSSLSHPKTKTKKPKPQGYWEADEEKIERLKQMYNEVEDKIEGVE